MRWLLAISILLVACGSDEPTGKTSHPSMPNQFEVGSTINGKYRVVEKLDDRVFVVERVMTSDQELTLIAAPTPALVRELRATEVEQTPDGRSYVVAALTDEQRRRVVGR